VGKEENQRNKEWFDEQIAEVISKKNSARERTLQREPRANCDRYKELRSR
jgi:hypothetical protein